MYAHISVGIYLYRSVDPIVPSAEHKSTGNSCDGYIVFAGKFYFRCAA